MAGIDVAIVGLGLMGSSALYQLAKRGFKVVGFDQFNPPHTLGSSAGDTRITRLAKGGFSYGFPAIDGPDGGVKIATEKAEQTTPGSIRRYVMPDEFSDMYENFIKERFPGLTPDCAKIMVCMYTKTPDSHFVVDFHPSHPQIIIASPCSGHGARHSGGMGEALAELATEGKTRFDISHFSLNRFKD